MRQLDQLQKPATERDNDQRVPTGAPLSGWWCVLLGVVCSGMFWLGRSSNYRGDGDLIVRLMESGLFFYQREMLAQMILTSSWYLLRGWGWNGFLVINLVSSIAGGMFIGWFAWWCSRWLGMRWLGVCAFLTSGIAIIFFGHPEYYALAYIAFLGFFIACERYLSGAWSVWAPALSFSLCAWTHLLGLVLLPALVLVYWYQPPRTRNEWGALVLGLFPLFVLFQSPRLVPVELTFHSTRGGFFQFWKECYGFDPEQQYPFLSWDHFLEKWYMFMKTGMWGWVWLVVLSLGDWKQMWTDDRFTRVLLVSAFVLFGWCVVWHPDLGHHEDWDLFSFPSFPVMLLVLAGIARTGWQQRQWALVLTMMVPAIWTYQDVLTNARIGYRARNDIIVTGELGTKTRIWINGHSHDPVIPSMLEGVHEFRAINLVTRERVVMDFRVEPDRPTRIEVRWMPARARVLSEFAEQSPDHDERWWQL